MSPVMLLELLGRKGKVRPEELRRLEMQEVPDAQILYAEWRGALDGARAFVGSRPMDEIGCLYVEPQTHRFFEPQPSDKYTTHYATKGGVVPSGVAFDGVEVTDSVEAFFCRKTLL